MRITNENIERLADAFADEYSNPPHFIVGEGVEYDEYLQMSDELKPELKEMFMKVINYILREHTIVNNDKAKQDYQRLHEWYKEAGNKGNEIDLDTSFGCIIQMKYVFGNELFEETQQ